MKIGLIFPNKDRKDKAVHLGLGYLASYARSRHDEIEIIILDTRTATKKETRRFFASTFDLIGITVLSPVYYEVISLFKTIRKANCTKSICLGGPYVTTLMEEIFVQTPADYAVYGEGEITFSELLFFIKGQRNLEEINGLMYRDLSGEIKTNAPRELITDLDSLPLPAYDLFKMNRYPVHRLVTSRGCPYRCAFCNSTSIWQFTWRKRSAENVVAEVEFLTRQFGNKTFSFNDNSFNIDMDRVDQFCDLLIEKETKILWSTPVRAEKINLPLARKMKKAGCYNVGVGIESANDAILKMMDKQNSIVKIEEGISIFKKAGIEVLGQFVIGSPGETLEKVKESLAYAKNSELDFVMFYSILPFKGTPQWDYVKSKGHFYSETIHDYHTIRPRIVFDTSEFPYQERLKAIELATREGFYSDSNDRNSWFDAGRNIVKYLQAYLPDSIGNQAYLFCKKLYKAFW